MNESTRPLRPAPGVTTVANIARRAWLRGWRGWCALPAWAKRPDFLAVLLAGAVLRLLWLDSTSFLGDQAELLALARTTLDTLALPLTGIRSSIGSMNPPASIYLLLPVARLDPFWAVLAGALANIGAVVLLYRTADRYVGRGAAFAAGLLYATAAAPVTYSRFLWQQNFLAPVLLLFFWTLCRGVVERRPGWLGWNVLLWAVAVQLHPTAAPLLLLIVVGALLTRRALGWRDLRTAALAVALPFLPSVGWELATSGSDFARLGASAGGTSIVDWAAVQMLLGMLQPASRSSLGASSLYASAYPTIAALPIVMALLAFASMFWIVASVVRPFVPAVMHAAAVLRQSANGLAPDRQRVSAVAEAEREPERHTAVSRGVSNSHAVALDDPRWRFLALLALWGLAPVTAMLRHSQTVYPHYLLVALPAAFLILGIFLARMAGYVAERAASWLPAPRRFARGTGRASSTAALARMGGWPRLADGSAVLAALLLLLALAQAYGTIAGLLAIQRGAFDATPSGARYGLPLDAQRAALLEAQRAAHPLDASVFVATDDLHQRPLGYLAATGNGPATVYDARDCLVVPSGGSTAQVTLAIEPGAASGELLRRLRGVTSLAALPTEGGITPALYRIPPGATLPGETAIPAAATATPASSGPLPTGYLFDRVDDGSARLVVHWSGAPALALGSGVAPRYVYGASPVPGAAPVAHYRFVAQPLDASGHALGAPLVAECPRLAWGTGESVYAWVPVPASPAGHVASWRLWVEGAPYLVTQPTLGPLRFTSGDTHEGARVRLGDEAVLPAR